MSIRFLDQTFSRGCVYILGFKIDIIERKISYGYEILYIYNPFSWNERFQV